MSDRASYDASGLERSGRDPALDEAAPVEAAQAPSTNTRICQDFMGGARSGVNGMPCFELQFAG